MGPSPTLVAPGLRTAARVGWRGGVASAVGVVADRPALWLFGALGYLLRGGVIVLTLAILVLPSPVSVRLMLGGYLGSSGLLPEFYVALGAVLTLLSLMVVLVLIVIALVELASFERFVAAEGGRLSAQRSAGRPSAGARRSLLGSLVIVQLVALAVLLVAALPLLLAAVQATYLELVRPSLAGGTLYDRVLAQLGGPALLLLSAMVLVEMASAVASRRLLAEAYGLGGSMSLLPARRGHALLAALRAIAAGLARPLQRPLSTLPTALLGWLAMLTVLLPLGWALALAWDAVRSEFLAGSSAGSGTAGLLLVSGLLSAVWLAGLGMAGFVSALRAGLWSSEELR